MKALVFWKECDIALSHETASTLRFFCYGALVEGAAATASSAAGAYSRFVSPIIGLVWIVVVSRILLTRNPAKRAAW
jgi:hypothetical protein